MISEQLSITCRPPMGISYPKHVWVKLHASSYNSIFFTFEVHCVVVTKGFLYKSWILTYKVFICIHRSNIDCLMDYMYAYLARTYYISTMTKIVAQLLLSSSAKALHRCHVYFHQIIYLVDKWGRLWIYQCLCS